MKRYIAIGIFVIVGLTDLVAYDEIDREGFKFGIGVVGVGGCDTVDVWDEKEENIVGTKRDCGGLPLVDMTLGYGLTPQIELSLDVKTLLLISLVGIKTKYYMHDTRDTAFLSLTGGVVKVGGAHSPGVISYNHIEYGYAYGKNEVTIGVGTVYGENNVVFHLGYKYMF